jgi:hypothetical protein
LTWKHDIDDFLHVGVEEPAAEPIKPFSLRAILARQFVSFSLDAIERYTVDTFLDAGQPLLDVFGQ